MRQHLSLLLLLASALVTAPARATTDAACWNTALERFDRYANPPSRGDSSFFTSVAQKGVVALAYGRPASMRQFPISLFEMRSDLGGVTPTGCTNQYLNNLNYFATTAQGAAPALAGRYSSTKVYPDPLRKGVYAEYRDDSDDLLLNRYYRFDKWPSPGTAGTPETVGTACLTAAASDATAAAACEACVGSNGYWLNPAVTAKDVSDKAGVFSTNFLRFHPPKHVLMLLVYKRLAEGPLLHELRQGNITAKVDGNGGFLNQKYLPSSCSGGGRPLNQVFTSLDDVGYTSAANPIAEVLFNAAYYNSSANWIPTYFADSRVNWTDSSPPCPGCVQNFVVLYSDGRGDTANPACRRNELGKLNGPCLLERACTTLGMGVEDDGDDYLDPAYAGLISGVTKQTPVGTCEMDFADDVARWMANNDMDPKHPGSDVTVFVIGLGSNRYNRMTILEEVAREGKGRYLPAQNFEELEAATSEVFQEIIRRSTSFSVAAITTVQTRGSTFAFIPRFLPLQGNIWEGKLFRFKLFNEFSAGCTTGDYGAKNAVNPNGNSSCADIYLRDGVNDFIGEDSDGNFLKLDTTQAPTPPPAITAWPLKVPAAPAVPVWEASDLLATRVRAVEGGAAAEARTIWTVVDTNSDGSYDTRVDFTAANASILTPRLALGGDGADGDFCAELAARTGKVFATANDCSAELIRYIHGHDILSRNPLNRTTPPPTPLYARPNVLGDIFHSSPILVTPPSAQFLCDLGVATQCLFSLYSPKLTPDGQTAYEGYASTHRLRQQFLLVGANDGMLHAFNAGNDQVGDDPETPYPEASTTHYFDLGTGRELWAFIPPDLLPKLRHYVLGTRHEIYVDGSPMVRDIWVDGSGASATVDRRKQADEFHTVAVVGERGGGRTWFALDVTNPTSPQFRWSWPPPGTTWSLGSGETWNDYAPAAPPIGPVALADSSGVFSVKGVRAAEKYVVALGGGYDPAGARGRSINLLDAWTGQAVFRFDREHTTSAAMAGPLAPVAAVPSLVDLDQDAIFDTLVVGDTRGQLWTMNLAVPGVDSGGDGLVDNWWGARAFQQFKNLAVAKASPFFQSAAVALLPGGDVRAYLGSGDRDQIRGLDGGTCGLTNVNACIRKGCNVDVTWGTHSVGTHSVTGRYTLTGNAVTAATDTLSSGGSLSSPGSACSDRLNVRFDYSLTCGTNALTSSNLVSCDWGVTAPGVDCTVTSGLETNPSFSTVVAAPPAGMEYSRLYSIKLYDTISRIPFTDSTSALGYDTERLSEATLVDADVTLAAANGNGWYVRHKNDIDERTASGALVLAGCSVWNSLTPSNATVGCGVIPKDTGRLYQADAITGATSCGSITTAARFRERPAIVPPPMPTPVVAVNPVTGQVTYSGISIEPGAPPLQISVGEGDLLGTIHWLEVPRALHQCRHEGICE